MFTHLRAQQPASPSLGQHNLLKREKVPTWLPFISYSMRMSNASRSYVSNILWRSCYPSHFVGLKEAQVSFFTFADHNNVVSRSIKLQPDQCARVSSYSFPRELSNILWPELREYCLSILFVVPKPGFFPFLRLIGPYRFRSDRQLTAHCTYVLCRAKFPQVEKWSAWFLTAWEFIRSFSCAVGLSEVNSIRYDA